MDTSVHACGRVYCSVHEGFHVDFAERIRNAGVVFFKVECRVTLKRGVDCQWLSVRCGVCGRKSDGRQANVLST